MKRFLYFISAIILVLCAFSCEKTSKTEDGGDIEFCSCLDMENINKTIPIVNDFMAGLPVNASKEYVFESLVTWLNSFPCNVNATVLIGTDMIWGEEQMYGVAIPVKDGKRIRELRFDFAIVNNALTYSQIAGYEYYKQDAIYVKTKYKKINEVFDFINVLDLDVEDIQGGIYVSSMPATSANLEMLTEKLEAKPYTNDAWVTGHLKWSTEGMTFFINLYDMRNRDYQTDWIQTMNEYEFVEYDGMTNTIVFYIPEDTGEQWEEIFENYDFVDWAELSHTRYTIR